MDFTPKLGFEVPAGWMIVDEANDYLVLGFGTTGAIVLQKDPIIASDAQECEGLAAPGGASAADAIVETLSADARLDTTVADEVTIGGFEGQTLDIELSPSWTGTCKWSEGMPAALILTVQDPPGPFFGIRGSERVREILLEVGDHVISIGIDAVDDEFVSSAMSIVESFRFTP